MGHWLFKEDPSHYSFDQLLREKRTVWEGVSNNLALQHLRRVRKGDRAFCYHTGGEKAVVGVMRIVSNPYPDPGRGEPRWVVVEVEAERRLRRPVTLGEIKGHPELSRLDLVRLPRLSVMPVAPAQWKRLMAMTAD